jgi:hypothetical protein
MGGEARLWGWGHGIWVKMHRVPRLADEARQSHYGFMRWSRVIGQFGGLVKLFPGSFYAASLVSSIV